MTRPGRRVGCLRAQGGLALSFLFHTERHSYRRGDVVPSAVVLRLTVKSVLQKVRRSEWELMGLLAPSLGNCSARLKNTAFYIL